MVHNPFVVVHVLTLAVHSSLACNFQRSAMCPYGRAHKVIPAQAEIGGYAICCGRQVYVQMQADTKVKSYKITGSQNYQITKGLDG